MPSLTGFTFRRSVAPVLVAALIGLLVPLTDSHAAIAPQMVSLKGAEFTFTPGTVSLTVGQPVLLSLENVGALDHDFKSDIPIDSLAYLQADNPLDEQQENSEAGALDIDYEVG